MAHPEKGFERLVLPRRKAIAHGCRAPVPLMKKHPRQFAGVFRAVIPSARGRGRGRCKPYMPSTTGWRAFGTSADAM
jgi:hypothetical protein